MIISIINYTVTGSVLGGLFTYAIYLNKFKSISRNKHESIYIEYYPYIGILPGLILGGYMGFVTRTIIIPIINTIVRI